MNTATLASAWTGIPKEMYLKILDYIPSVYEIFLDAYKVYLTRNEFPKTNTKKFFDFLINLNIIKTDEDDPSDVLTEEELKVLFMDEIRDNRLH